LYRFLDTVVELRVISVADLEQVGCNTTQGLVVTFHTRTHTHSGPRAIATDCKITACPQMEPKTGVMQNTSGPYAKVNLGPLHTPSPGLALQVGHVEINMQNAFGL